MKRGRNQGNTGPNSVEVTAVRIVRWKTRRHFLLLQAGGARPGATPRLVNRTTSVVRLTVVHLSILVEVCDVERSLSF